MPFSIAGALVCSLGIGAGPALDATLRLMFPGFSEQGSQAAPACCLAAVWMLLTAASFLVVPAHLEPEGHDCDKHASFMIESADLPGKADVHQSGRTQEHVEHDGDHFFSKRAKVWMSAAAMGMERALIVSALEAASSLLLEMKYGFRRRMVGLAVGCTFVLGTPLMIGLGRINPGQRQLSEGALMCMLTVATLMFSVLFLQGVGSVFISGLDGYWTVLLADSLLFPTAYTASGIAEGVLLKHSKPGTLFSAEANIIVDAVLQDSIARFFGPPLARWVIDRSNGQNAYAILQAGLCTVSCITSFRLWHLVSREKDEDRQVA